MTDAPALLTDRIVLVTGASRGIGRACALSAARAGAQVIISARTQGGLEELDDEIQAATGRNATIIPFDLIDGGAIDRLGGALYERFGRLDGLVHAAAMLGGLTPVSHMDPRDFAKVMGVNLTATYRLIRSLEPLLRVSDAGRAVFFTSGAAARPRAFWGAYAASKAGLEALVRCWADEVENTDMRAAIVDPGATRTRMRYEAYPGEDQSKLNDPADVAPLAVELLAPNLKPTSQTIRFVDWRQGSSPTALV